VRGPHALGDDLHRAGDAIETMGDFIGEGDREVVAFGPRAIHRGLSRRRDRGDDHRPHRQNDDDADGDDLDRDGSGVATRIAGERGEQTPGLRGGRTIEAQQG
jgi:hypothetical protein